MNLEQFIYGVNHEAGPGTVLHFDNGFKQTEVLDRLAIKVCCNCGYFQPIEILQCKKCGVESLYIRADFDKLKRKPKLKTIQYL